MHMLRPLLTTLAMLTFLAAACVVYWLYGDARLFPIALLAAVANTIFVLWRRSQVSGSEPPARHSRAIWWSAALLAPVSYVLGAPFVLEGVHAYLPAALPVVRVVYLPLRWYTQQQDLPGAELFNAYASFVVQAIDPD